MPKAHADQPKTATSKASVQLDAGKDKDKSGLKGMSFEEGEKARSPVQHKGGKSIGARIGGALGLGRSKDKGPKTDDSVIDDDTPAPDTNTASPVGKEREAAYASAKKQNAALEKWCVKGVDDEFTVTNCAVTRSCSPDDAPNMLAQAKGQVNVLKTNRVYQQRYAHMKDEEIMGVALYTTNAAYPINGILRGLLKSSPWISTFGPMVSMVNAGLKAAPKGSRNQQVLTNLLLDPSGATAGLLDDSKDADDILPIKECYRQDGWNPAFDRRFAADFKVGRALEEPGFYSATLNKGQFSAGSITTTCINPKIARSVADMSLCAEAEVVMPPGQRFQIVGIDMHDKSTGQVTAVSDPTAKLPQSDRSGRAFNKPSLAWEVKVKHVGVAKNLKKNAESYDDKKSKGSKLRSKLGLG